MIEASAAVERVETSAIKVSILTSFRVFEHEFLNLIVDVKFE